MLFRFNLAGSERARDAGDRLRERVKHTVGITVAVEVVPPGTLERSVGKLRRIVDRR